MKLTVKLTAECIRDGVPDDWSGCPVVLGITHAFRDAGIEIGAVETVGATAAIWGPSSNPMIYFATLPEDLTTFMENFDEGLPVAPLEAVVEFRDAGVAGQISG